jgi:general secretion pathway protein I
MTRFSRSVFGGRRVGAGTRAFTLLEVLVAVAILGLGLTVILSSQAGLFSSAKRTRNLTQAVGLLRCKMSEAEAKLAAEGFPLADEDDEGACCDSEEESDFQCKWQIQRIQLPQPAGLDATDGGVGLGSSGTEDGTGSAVGPLGALAAIEQSQESLGENPDLGSISQMMGGSASVQGMAPMVMGLVYPDLKPMLEASIRKVTVTVIWKEGVHERTLDATQYITSPQQGGFDATAAEGLSDAIDALGAANPASPAPGGTE